MDLATATVNFFPLQKYPESDLQFLAFHWKLIIGCPLSVLGWLLPRRPSLVGLNFNPKPKTQFLPSLSYLDTVACMCITITHKQTHTNKEKSCETETIMQ